MRYEKKITRENAYELIKLFAKEYRKELGKAPCEIIIVGGGSIVLNYKFREATQDLDVILKAASGIHDVIAKFADDNDLPRDWMNSDFMKTTSYSRILSEVSTHFCTLNNSTLEIRTVTGVYLIAMKLRARRDYRNDISDAIGIIIEEREVGKNISFEEIQNAYSKLYNEKIQEELSDIIRNICRMDLIELKSYYKNQIKSEQAISGKLVTYVDNGVNINTGNVNDVINKIKEKMKK